MKKHIPNLLTSSNLATGCVGIYYVLLVNSSSAIYFVAIAAFFDFLDGFAARLLKVQSPIGKQLDSLADLVSFGVLPSFFIFTEFGSLNGIQWVILLIPVCSAFRLAKFNLDETQADSFLGLPTPANALMLTSLVFLAFEFGHLLLIALCLSSSFLLVAPVRLIALKFRSFQWKGNEGRWVLLVVEGCLLVIFQHSFIPFLIPVYIIVSIGSNLLSK